MEVDYDPAKDEINKDQHGISLKRAADIDVLAFVEDARTDYGELRYRAYGLIDRRAYCLIFTLRGTQVRAISLRRAHAKEMRRYAGSA